jgi:carboxypeptidase C (cathepsin A)
MLVMLTLFAITWEIVRIRIIPIFDHFRLFSQFHSYLKKLSGAWTLALDWKGKDEFNAAKEHDWQGKGLARAAKGLTFLQVYDAGHMVPADKPEAALEMLTTFLANEAF